MLAHDEVRQRPRGLIAVADEAHAESGAGLVLDANDLDGKVEDGFLAGKHELELGGSAGTDELSDPEKKTAARDILDESVEDDTGDATLRTSSDGDSNSSPLVHVVKATLATYCEESNPKDPLVTLTFYAMRRSLLRSDLLTYRFPDPETGP